MTLLDSHTSRISKDELEKIFIAHNLGNLKYVKSISKGIASSTYSLITESESYILTLFEEEVYDLSYQKEISQFFSYRGFPLSKIVATCEIQKKQGAISSHLHGKIKTDWSSDDYESIGFLLGNLHKCSNSLPISTSATPFIWALSNSFFELQKYVPKEFLRLEQEIYFIEEAWPHDLPKGIIHGDLWHKNILFEGDAISGLLDFKASYEPYILDLANLLKKLPQTDQTSRSALLSGYEISRPLSLQERESLDLLIYSKVLSTILYLLKKSIHHPNRKDEFQTYAYLGLLKLDSLANSL